jgi:catechol 2,3-dioxygenase-like lactoylglutathione lyase family enzyme
MELPNDTLTERANPLHDGIGGLWDARAIPSSNRPDPANLVVSMPAARLGKPAAEDSMSNPTDTKAATVETKLEALVIPVADVDRAKRFYGNLGWRLDADFAFDNGFRVVQFTPPGSPCSVQFGANITTAPPGSAQGLYLIVSDIEAARAELSARGADVSPVFHPEIPGAQFKLLGSSGRVSGPAPDHLSYRSFATFNDPDGNTWLLQEVRTRLPGRGLSLDVATLTELLRDAEQRHGKYEPTAPKHHWSTWYAAYVIACQRGRTPEQAVQDATDHTEGRA